MKEILLPHGAGKMPKHLQLEKGKKIFKTVWC